MHILKFAFTTTCALTIGFAALAAPPAGKGGSKGGGGEDPPPEPFSPAIAYFEQGRQSKDLKLANRNGDQACLVMRSQSGAPTLRGFVYHAASKVLAYSIDNSGIFLATWDTDPCLVGSGQLIRPSANPEFMDFSPDGKYLTWTEPVDGYSGFGSAAEIFIYNLESGTLSGVPLDAWGGTRPEWGVDGEWGIGPVLFSPDFLSSNELVFRGAPLDGSAGEYDSLFAYNIDGTTAPRKFFDGAGGGIDVVMSVSNPQGAGDARVAIRKGPIRQIAISDGSQGPSFDGYEPAYSCDNSELIHRTSPSSGKYQIQITSADGTSTETWSKANLRFFDWFCP